MQFKLDENVHPAVAGLLAGAGHDADTVHDEHLQGCTDAALAEQCRAEGRVIVTLDMDFADVRTFPPAAGCGVIVLRIRSQSRRHVLEVVGKLLDLLARETVEGRLWIVSESSVRIRE